MKKILNYKITNRAINKIESLQNKLIDEITKEEIDKILEINCELIELVGYIFIEDDLEPICDHTNLCKLYILEEMDIYISIDPCTGEYISCGYLNGLTDFVDLYLMYLNVENDYDRGIFLTEELEKISWYDTECQLYKEIKEELNKIHEDEGEDEIYLYGNAMSIDIESALINDKEYSDANYKEIGYYCNKFIYEINKKLYYLTEDSYTFNTEYHLYLKEVGASIYKYFGYTYN